MNTLTIDHLLRAAQLFEQQTALQLGLVGRGSEMEETLTKMVLSGYNIPPANNNNNNNNVNGYCSSYNSGNSTTSSLRSSPTSSMLSSGPTSPLHLPPQPSLITIKKKSPSSTSKQSRAAHNELEKNRRANLRSYLDQIKDILPPEYDSSRDTTLSLLTRARNHIRQWRQKRDSLVCRRNELAIRNAKLKERIEKAKSFRNSNRCRQEEKPSGEVKPVPVEITSVIEASRTSPLYLEYSPSNKPTLEVSNSKMVTIDPYLEGLLPAAPLIYPYVYQPRSTLI